MVDNKLIIGHKLRAVREMQGITQEFLADKLDLSQTSLSKIENGEMKIAFEKVCEIAEILEVDVNTIINFDKSVIFNSCSQSGQHNNYNYNGVEEVKEVYEKLLFEKDERIKEKEDRIKTLETLLKK